MTARDLVAMGVSAELFAVEASRPVEDAVRLMGDTTSRRSRSPRADASSGRSTKRTSTTSSSAIELGRSRRDDRAAGVPLRGHLDAGGVDFDDDHARESSGAGARFKTDKTFIITRSDIIRVMM